jgi:membrane protease YdiL (CAAX protease family)
MHDCKVYCPVCGGAAEETKCKRLGKENLTLLLIPVCVILGAVVGYFGFFLVLSLLANGTSDMEELENLGLGLLAMLMLPAIGGVGAGFWGNGIIRRHRRRKGLRNRVFRCTECKNMFIPKK